MHACTHTPLQYMYTCTRAHTHTPPAVHVCTCTRMHIHTPQYMYTRARTHTHTPQQYMHAHARTHTPPSSTCTHTRACTHTPTHQRYMYARVHTHTHTSSICTHTCARTHPPQQYMYTCTHMHTHTESEVLGLCDAMRRPKLGKNYLVIFAHCSLCHSRGLMAEQVSVFQRACWLACPLLGPSWPHSLVSTTSLTGPSMSFKCSSSWWSTQSL